MLKSNFSAPSDVMSAGVVGAVDLLSLLGPCRGWLILWSSRFRLKKAEAVVKTKEETKQGAMFKQVVQKPLISPTPLQELSRKMPLTPISFLTHKLLG